MSVAIVSLFPLDATGGGELYTIQSAQAVRATTTPVAVAAPVMLPAPRGQFKTRMQTRFIWTDVDTSGAPEVIEWSDVLARLAVHDHVWIHQYLSSDLVFDVITSVASDQWLLFTSLGHEQIRDLFDDLYQPGARHQFVEISEYAARRARTYAPDATWVRAAVWRGDMRQVDHRAPPVPEYVALGRILPHKGLETTIAALAPGERLHVVGPSPDTEYASFLRTRAAGKDVEFHGCLQAPDVRRLLARSTALVAASTHRLFDGRRIEQVELLGLVLCEALRDGTLPVASDVPAFVEVMNAMGLSGWTFAEGEPSALRQRLDDLASRGDQARALLLSTARHELLGAFSWDDYWPRVVGRLEEGAACG